MFKNNICLIFVLSCFTTWGQIFPRYNHVGYSPKAPKIVFVQADQNAAHLNWSVLDSTQKVLKKGILGVSIEATGKYCPKPFNYKIDFSTLEKTGNYSLQIETYSEKIPIKISANPTDFITSDILRYLRVQRSGTTRTLDSHYSHGGDKSCAVWTKKSGSNSSWQVEPSRNQVDMLGGWYDAGDYIKFTLTTAYTSYLLLRSYEVNPALFQTKKYSKSELNDVLDEAKWGLLYLLKTHPDPNTFIIQVGSADDHKQGERLAHQDQLDSKRQAYHAFSPTQMGTTAAALALGATTFAKIDPAFSAECKSKAISIFKKSLDYQENAWIEEGWETFYSDKNSADNLELAAAELYKLTNEQSYIVLARKFSKQAGQAWWCSWANVNMLAHDRIAKYDTEALDYLKADLTHFQGIATEKNNLWGTPHKFTWASLYSMIGVANAALLSNKYPNTTFSQLYFDVLDYTLGRNPWGICFVASPEIPKSIRNVYSQVYKLQPRKYPIGAIAEGPGDRATHDNLKKYFKIPEKNNFDEFNTSEFVFYDHDSDFQCMETTIVGLADGLFFFSLISQENHSKQ